MKVDPYQQKSLLLFGIISLTITVFDIIFIVFFPKLLQNFLSVNVFFIIFSIFLALNRLGGAKASASPSEKKLPLLKWLGAIVAIECLAGLFFVNLLQTAQLFLNAEIIQLHFHVPAAKQILTLLFLKWGLFPFSLIAILAAGLAYVHFRQKESATISNLIPSVKKTYYEVFIKRVVNGSLGAISNFVMIISISLGVLALGRLILSVSGVHGFVQIRIGSMIFFFVVTLLSVLKVIPWLADAFSKTFRHESVAILLYMLFALVLFLLCYFFAFDVVNFAKQYVTLPNFQHLTVRNHFIVHWPLLFWAWWTCWSPLLASAIARVSRGYSIRAIIVTTLFFPAIVAVFLLEHITVPGLATVSEQVFHAYWLAIIGPLILVGLLMRVNGGKLLVFGLMPRDTEGVATKTIKPINFVRSTLQVTIVFMALFLIRNIYGIQFLTMLAAIPNTVLFIVMAILFYKKLLLNSRNVLSSRAAG